MAFCLFSRYCALLFNLFLTLIYIFQVVGGEGVWAETPLNIGSTYTAYWYPKKERNMKNTSKIFRL